MIVLFYDYVNTYYLPQIPETRVLPDTYLGIVENLNTTIYETGINSIQDK